LWLPSEFLASQRLLSPKAPKREARNSIWPMSGEVTPCVQEQQAVQARSGGWTVSAVGSVQVVQVLAAGGVASGHKWRGRSLQERCGEDDAGAQSWTENTPRRA